MLNHPTILERVISPQRGGFSPELAREVLKFAFPPEDRTRYQQLSSKAQDGLLTPEERAELEDYLDVDDLLMILKAKAQVSLRDPNPQSPAA